MKAILKDEGGKTVRGEKGRGGHFDGPINTFRQLQRPQIKGEFIPVGRTVMTSCNWSDLKKKEEREKRKLQ